MNDIKDRNTSGIDNNPTQDLDDKEPQLKIQANEIGQDNYKPLGPIIGIVLIIAIILAGGLYFLSQQSQDTVETETEELTTEEEALEIEDLINSTEDLSSSDEIEAIENDLNNTDLEALEREMEDLLQELEEL